MTTSVPLAPTTADMLLASDLCDDNDNVLLPHSSVLTPSIIDALQRRGIVHVDVASAEAIDNIAPSAADISKRSD